MAGTTVIQIRRMRQEDVAAVAALEAAVYPQPWSSRVFLDELAQESRVYFLAEAGDRVLGYGGLLLVADEAHVTTLAVDPESRRRRVGTRLMLVLARAALEAGARHLTLEVRMSNSRAQALYRKFGFAPVGLRKNYYGDEDALVMWAVDIDRPEYRERLNAISTELAAHDGETPGGGPA